MSERRGGLVDSPPAASDKSDAQQNRDSGPIAVQASDRRLSRNRLRAFSLVSLASAVGLLLVAVADTQSRFGFAWSEELFWIGIAAIFVPIAARLVGPVASPRERLWLVLVAGVSCYLVKVMRDPLAFTYHDELGHFRSTADILSSGHLFAHNPLVSAYPYYPGLELVTASVVKVGHLSIFHAGILLLGLTRIALCVALFLFYQRVGGSARVAGIACALYMGNPNFLFFDSQFAYETLALPLGLIVLYALSGPPVRGLGPRTGLILIVLALIATHHMTPAALSAFLLAWVGIHLGGKRREHGDRDWTVVAFAFFTSAAFAGWFAFVAGSATLNELGPSFSGALKALADLLNGSGAKQVFGSSRGASDTPLVQAVGFASVCIVLIGLPVGLRKLWARHGRDVLALVLTGAAIFYPFTLLLRLTQSGTEISNRASEFLFVGIAFLLALAIVDLKLPARIRRIGPAGKVHLTTLAAAMCVSLVYLGGVSVGSAPYSRLPGKYLVGADARSVDPHTVAAAHWAGRHLPVGSRVVTDRTLGELITAYGPLDQVTGLTPNGTPVPNLLSSLTFGLKERQIIASEKVAYVIVDRRLSTGVPAVGVYFDREEAGAYHHKNPISGRALAKFDSVPGVSRIYDDGTVAIYDTSSLR